MHASCSISCCRNQIGLDSAFALANHAKGAVHKSCTNSYRKIANNKLRRLENSRLRVYIILICYQTIQEHETINMHKLASIPKGIKAGDLRWGCAGLDIRNSQATTALPSTGRVSDHRHAYGFPDR